MRIIAGKYRGRRLKSPPSDRTRPTSDRLRETLFNVLATRLEDAKFLDLCAGTGAVGIEALSRGASHVVFVDQSRQMCALIEENLSALKIDEHQFEILCAEASEFLRRSAKKASQRFDLIYFDPPYAAEYENVLRVVGENAKRLLADDGRLIVEHYKKMELQEEFGALGRKRVLGQGDAVLSFYAGKAS